MIISTLLVPFCLLLGLLPSAPVDPLDRGLIAYYSFNQCDARDDSGHGNDGRIFGGVNCWCGVDDDGLLLDGNDDYLEFHGIVNRYFTTSDFTISFYFKPEGVAAGRQSLMSKREACEEYFMLDFLLDPDEGQVETSLHESPYKFFPNLSPAVPARGWHHIALVREGLYAYTYINGRLSRESYRCSDLDISNGAVLSFANSPCVSTGEASRFKGVIDEFRVYDHALNADDIRRLYGLHPIESALMDCFAMAAPPQSETFLAGR